MSTHFDLFLDDGGQTRHGNRAFSTAVIPYSGYFIYITCRQYNCLVWSMSSVTNRKLVVAKKIILKKTKYAHHQAHFFVSTLNKTAQTIKHGLLTIFFSPPHWTKSTIFLGKYFNKTSKKTLLTDKKILCVHLNMDISICHLKVTVCW